jgi:YegS/Rv2252/BmrU family lipid kinase
LTNQTSIFIINPIAGSKNIDFGRGISHILSGLNLSAQIVKTQYKGHAIEIVEEFLSRGFTQFIAVGGDGTVNEVASALVNTKGNLSIIPVGSGNGLARAIGISMVWEKALQRAINGTKRSIDVGYINEKPFFCTSGIGFDALCAYHFAQGSHKRGLSNYVKIILQTYFGYSPSKIAFQGQDVEYFSLTFANANQFGNDAFIAPDAILDDGMLDCSIIGPHPKWYGTMMGYLLMSGKIRTSKYVEYYRGKTFELTGQSRWLIHIDGESVELESDKISVSVREKALGLMI